MATINRDNLVQLAEVEKVLLPTALQELSLDFILPNLSAYLTELFRLSGLFDFTEKDLSFSKHSFQYPNGNAYYVFVVHFPFEMIKDYVGCLNRAFIVFAPHLRKAHYFGEILTEQFYKYEPLRLKLQYFCHKGNDIYSYEVMDRTVKNDEIMAYQCPTMAYVADNGGVAGVKYNTFWDVKKVIDEKINVLTNPAL